MHVLIIPSEHFVTDTQPLGGIFQYHQAKALSHAGHKVGVLSVGYITPRYLISGYAYKKNERLEHINIKRAYKQLFFPHRIIPHKILKKMYIRIADGLCNEYIKEYGKPDVIHAHNFFYAGVMAQYLKEKYGIHYIITEHSSFYVKNRVTSYQIEILKSVATEASKVTVVSSALKSILKKYIKEEIGILHNIVDDFFFKKEFQNNRSDNFVFLNVASLDNNKNQTLLIESFAKVVKKQPKVHLKLAGDGYMRNSLETLVKKLNLTKQVSFLGRISQEKVREEMMGADCFVLSSDFETFGVVLIEALACGLPIIATKCGGPVDIVTNSNGILIDVKNEKQLENAMTFMYFNAHKYDKKHLRAYAWEKFGEHAFINYAMKLYNQGIKQ